ncbi:MAG: transglutaminase-like domain-containing protein, partial [bacterium]
YIGGALYRSAAKSTIPYDTSIEKINYIMACTVYLSGTQWVILDAIRISPPTRPTGVYSSFSETREITVEPPTAPTDTQQYSILIYEKSSLEVKGMPDGYSMHAQPEYPSLNPWYNFRTSFTVPKDIVPYTTQYDLKGSSIKNYVLSEKTSGDSKTYTFSLPETSFEKKDAKYSTKDNGTFPYVGFSTFKDWKSMNKYLYDSYEPIITEGKKDAITELELAKANTDGEKGSIPEQIYYHIVNLYRYVYNHQGSGAHVPNPLSEIIKNKSGDCKDLATIGVALLRAAGYTAYPIILRTNASYNYDLDIPGIEFDHAIVKYFDDGGEHFMDLVGEGAVGFGMLPEMDLDRNYVTYTSSSGDILKGRTPSSNVSSKDIQYEYKITEDKKEGKLNCAITSKQEYCGEDAYSFYWNNSTLADDQKADYLKEYTSSGLCDMKKYEVLALTPDYVCITTEVEQDGAIILYNDQMIEITPGAVTDSGSLSDVDKNEPRVLAVTYSGQNDSGPYEKSIIYDVPEGYEIDYIPEPFEYHSAYLDLLIKFEKINDGKQVKLSRSTIYKDHTIPAEKFREEQENMRAIYKYKTSKELVLRKKS